MTDKTPEVIINPILVEPSVKTNVGPSVKNKLGIQKSNLEIIDIIFYIILIIILILYLFQYNSLKNIKNDIPEKDYVIWNNTEFNRINDAKLLK